jgi:hypothetical protein
MAEDSDSKLSPEEIATSFRDLAGKVKPTTSWVLPLITAVVLISAFCLYYFVYVAARREYLVNRNFRSLAVLGDQVQSMVTMHSSILEFVSHLGDPTRDEDHGKKRENLEKFVVIRPEDLKKPKEDQHKEALKDYLKYLAPGFALTNKGRAGQSRLEVQRRNGCWELVLTAHKHPGSKKDYVGWLELSPVLGPLVASLPFDDILLVSRDGTIVYQRNTAGPQFTTLSGLLQAEPEVAQIKTEPSAEEHSQTVGSKTNEHLAVGQNTDKTWQIKSKHLTDIVLAGTHYKLFLQPVLLDVYNDKDERQDEPAQEWVLCGLRSAKALEWEALSISSTFMVWITTAFLAIFMSSPILKVLFMNNRQHLRLREIGWLSSAVVLLAIVFTLSGLNAVGFPLNDDTDQQLNQIGNRLANDVHDELRQMLSQLLAWCHFPERDDKHGAISQTYNVTLLKKDLGADREVIRSYRGPEDAKDKKRKKNEIEQPPPQEQYAQLNNASWTDDDGQQIVKWSTGRYLTPMIDVSEAALFTHPKNIYLDGKGPAFHFDSVVPPNKVDYLAGLAISTEDCIGTLPPDLRSRSDLTGGTAVLTAQPLSLIDPILPYGYGFALLDDKGVVLFHSDKTRNLRENFLQETDWNKQLRAAMFGHSNQHPLEITYMGKDYRALVVPIPGISQSGWSLIVYRDLTSIRTLNLQAIIMASTLLLLVFGIPAAAFAIWSLILRPQFAPEWLWPNQARMVTYVYQIAVYALLVILFLFLGFTGSSEQNFLACVTIPYTALLLTVWSITAYAPEREKVATRRARRSYPWLLLICISMAGFGLIWWVHLPAFTFLAALVVIAIVPLLDPLRRYLLIKSKRLFRRCTAAEQPPGPGLNLFVYRSCYIGSVAMLLLLIGIMVPTALFRTSLIIEQRLSIKQAQLHLASAVDQRLVTTKQRCESDQLGHCACQAFGIKDTVAKNSKIQDTCKIYEPISYHNGDWLAASTPWNWIVVDRTFSDHASLSISSYSAPSQHNELYRDWFSLLIYWLHHDYNQTASETLAMISDRVDIESGVSTNPVSSSSPSYHGQVEKIDAETTEEGDPVGKFAEWSWDSDGSKLTLRWHGVHVPSSSNATRDENHDAKKVNVASRQTENARDPESSLGKDDANEDMERDLLVSSVIPTSLWGDVFKGIGIAIAAITVIGLIVWALVCKIFLFHIAPLTITGEMRAAEAIREGQSVVILTPLVSDWRSGTKTPPLDLRKIGPGPTWGEERNLEAVPVNSVVEIRHFEHRSSDPEFEKQKFILLQRLLAIKNIQLVIVMTVAPSAEDYSRLFREYNLEVIDLRDEPFCWLEQYKGSAQDLIWNECGPMAALWPIGAQLALDIKTEKVHSAETIASEVLERADGYYRLVWNECSNEQKFVLSQLAEDGLLNPTNARAIRQLVRKGVIKADPQFHIMNESFRRFVCSATTLDMKQAWLRESRRSGWGKVHGAFFTTMILLGAFLLTTQNALWQSSAAYVTTALGALGTIVRLFNNYRGGKSTERAS